MFVWERLHVFEAGAKGILFVWEGGGLRSRSGNSGRGTEDTKTALLQIDFPESTFFP